MDTPEERQPTESPDSPAASLPEARHGLLRYTAERVVLLIAVVGVLWLIGIRSNPLLLVALALVISGFISMVVLNRSRDAASVSVASMFRRMNDRIDASARAEDEPPPHP